VESATTVMVAGFGLVTTQFRATSSSVKLYVLAGIVSCSA
jgi:hypothetical protein